MEAFGMKQVNILTVMDLINIMEDMINMEYIFPVQILIMNIIVMKMN